MPDTALSHPRRVCLLSTGGTIASTHDPATGADSASLDGDALLAMVHNLPPELSVCTHTVAVMNSWHATPAWMRGLAQTIARIVVAHAPSGVVVTHGTDTLEETAFVLDGLVRESVPVILTGSMRSADHPVPDGPRNLGDALALASASPAAAPGVQVTFAGRTHRALDVRKWHATDDDAFRSSSKASALEDGSEPRPSTTRVSALPDAEPDPGVLMVRAVAGGSRALLTAARQAQASGLVVEAFGAGNVHPDDHTELDRLRETGTTVVLATRCSQGRVAPLYGGRGGGAELLGAGIIPAGRLSGLQARLALSFLIGSAANEAAIRRWFEVASAEP